MPTYNKIENMEENPSIGQEKKQHKEQISLKIKYGVGSFYK